MLKNKDIKFSVSKEIILQFHCNDNSIIIFFGTENIMSLFCSIKIFYLKREKKISIPTE